MAAAMMKPGEAMNTSEKTPEEKDEEERTTPVGLFHVADSYWGAAHALAPVKLETTHPDFPISFFYYHAIELYLKAFLRLHGPMPMDLRERYGHKTSTLSKRATELGLRLRAHDKAVLSFIATT